MDAPPRDTEQRDGTGTRDQQGTGTTTDQQRDQDVRDTRHTTDMDGAEGRSEALSELEDLLDRIDDRKDALDERMVRTENEQQRAAMHDYRRDLEKHRARVVDEIRNIEVAEQQNWTTVRQRANTTAQDVGNWFDRQGDRFEQLIGGDDGDTDDDDMD